jgi:hypothetical protein
MTRSYARAGKVRRAAAAEMARGTIACRREIAMNRVRRFSYARARVTPITQRQAHAVIKWRRIVNIFVTARPVIFL